MKILVLGGGDSLERPVSIKSAKSVVAAARAAGFEVSTADPKDGYQSLDNLNDAIVFPILHGTGGEDGVIQKELEARRLPFLGSASQSSQDCFDKWRTRQILAKGNIEMARAEKVKKENYQNSELYKSPFVLKIIHGGSSIGTLMNRNPGQIDNTLADDLFNLENDALIEELVEGVEITVPILDKSALPAIEVRPPDGKEFDYENKYNGQSQELCPPPSLSDERHQEAMRLAERVHEIMGCQHLSRVDMIMRPDGSLVILEINTIPGLTDQSLYPKAAKVTGISMPELVKEFVGLIKRDYSY